MPKPPPKFVTNIGAWEYVLAKLSLSGDKYLTPNGDPKNYGQAVAIYKRVVAKYAHFGVPNVDVEPLKIAGQKAIGFDEGMLLGDLCSDYPIGTMFWMDDVLCEAIERNGGLAVYPDPEGYLLINAKVLDVDPEGQYRSWEVGKIFGAQPHRCADFVEAAV